MKSATAPHLRRCTRLEMALPFRRVVRLAAGVHLRFSHFTIMGNFTWLDRAVKFRRVVRLVTGVHLRFSHFTTVWNFIWLDRAVKFRRSVRHAGVGYLRFSCNEEDGDRRCCARRCL